MSHICCFRFTKFTCIPFCWPCATRLNDPVSINGICDCVFMELRVDGKELCCLRCGLRRNLCRWLRSRWNSWSGWFSFDLIILLVVWWIIKVSIIPFVPVAVLVVAGVKLRSLLIEVYLCLEDLFLLLNFFRQSLAVCPNWWQILYLKWLK